MKKQRVLSGMRPTGSLHLGHLVGALKNWVELQTKFECLFMVADWHALMSEYLNPKNVFSYIQEMVIDWISCGIDPEKSIIFLQSGVHQHLDLYILFSIITPLSWLERCPSYKEQLKELRDHQINTYGFLGYPLLQAADILSYKAEVVPVGEDQLPHLELTRQIARRFHHLYGKKIFPEPQAYLTKTPRLLGLDGRKMSKSYNNYIALSDEPAIIKKKITTMFTDPKRIYKHQPGHPQNCNVFSYYAVFYPQDQKKLKEACTQAKLGCKECKEKLANILVDYLKPFQRQRKQLLEDKEFIHKILKEGTEKASLLASYTIEEVKKIIKL